MRRRIAACIPSPDDSTAYYRMVAPLSHLQQTWDYQVTALAQVNTPTAQFFDLALFQRPCSPAELGAMNTFKRMGIPVIVDYDDNLMYVPNDNPSYFHFADPNLRSAFFQSIEMADAVTVSTEELKRYILKVIPTKHVVVIRNAIDERLPNYLGRNEESDRILWRGTSTHQRDLFAFKDQLDQIEEKITYFGYYPWFLKPGFEVKNPANPITEYFLRLRALEPKFGIVPLHDCEFNRCKSNIAWLEMAWVGAVCLVPSWEEWDVEGTITYSGVEDFLRNFKYMTRLSNDELSVIRNNAWQTIQNHYMLKHTNLLRHELFQKL